MNQLLIELQYFGTISWYMEILRYEKVTIECYENFEKSTYRNRCYIASPDGKLRLSIPLVHGRNQRAKYAEVKIDNSANWRKTHWNSLCSSYRKSPYFEYYEDRFKPLFHSNHEYLFDFNKELMTLLVELLGLSKEIGYTTVYEKKPSDVADCRSKILPQVEISKDQSFPVVYRQVFEERTGFMPDLCIADLLFNEGPHSLELLK